MSSNDLDMTVHRLERDVAQLRDTIDHLASRMMELDAACAVLFRAPSKEERQQLAKDSFRAKQHEIRERWRKGA